MRTLIHFFGYMMNEEIGEILFYDIVLLVEGVSEKYFYNLLLHNDKKFMKFCSTNNMGIFCVSGVDFYPVKKLLGDLGIRVMIKTDNDIFKVPKISKKRYAGIERVIDCLDDKGKKELANILGIKKINKETFRFDINEDVNNDVEIKMEDIQNLFFKYDVFLSVGHNGFEEDFLEFISEEKIPKEDLDYLKKAKSKNFHRYIIDSGINVEINDRNKSSILVRFINEK